MRLFIACIASIILCALGSINIHAAPSIGAPPEQVSSKEQPITITAFGIAEDVPFVEIYNQLDIPVDITGWKVTIVAKHTSANDSRQTTTLTLPNGWLLPGGYFTLQADDVAGYAVGVLQQSIVAIELTRGDEIKQFITVPDDVSAKGWFQHKQRGKTKLTDTQNLLKDYSLKKGAIELYSQPLYLVPPLVSGLRIDEIVAHPAQCAPNDSSAACGDYVKVFNASTAPINLADYRLRTGFQGQNASLTTRFNWNRPPDVDDDLMLAPGAFFTVIVRDDSSDEQKQPLQLTNSGGYVWLEDKAGATIYRQSIVQYPEKSAGISWAYDPTTGSWRDGTPRPLGHNSFLAEAADVPETMPNCQAGYERHPATQRCRKIVVADTAACQPGYYRHPETQRCRLVATTTTTVPTPCQEGYARHPTTQRCRKVETSVADTPVACKPGQERSPETNRCRKVATTSTPAAIATDVPAQSSTLVGWTIGGIVATGALGYAIYEWRQPIGSFFGRVFRRK